MKTIHIPRKISAFLIGVLFGLGLIVSQMTNPDKVINFLDVFGSWDPSLFFVMVGAVPVTFIGYKIVHRNDAPVFEETFKVPTSTQIDPRLIIGAIIFGIGWGLSGLCPAPSLVGAGAGVVSAVIFVACMIAGMIISQRFVRRII